MRKLTLSIFISCLLIACVSSPPPEPTPKPLPPPSHTCAEEQSWHNIVPGQSTRQDVRAILGAPDSEGTDVISREKPPILVPNNATEEESEELWGEKTIPYWAYTVEGGRVSTFVQDRVFFRPDGVVDWIEMIVADRDGTFHSVEQIVAQLGETLDMAIINSSTWHHSPSLMGPDQLYIWSECGLVVHTLRYCVPDEHKEKVKCKSKEIEYYLESTDTLTQRYPAGDPIDLNSIVVMKFLFPPTTFEGFKEFYFHKVPFGLWDEYLPIVREDALDD
ncbi:MAG: hypothetical protein ACPGWR_01975 [Ardenticatenaceae bacterium]